MYHMGAQVRVAEDDPRSGQIWERLLNICCDSFGLCASVGCSCGGGEGERKCSEVVHGERYKLAVSEGPTWVMTILRLPNTLSVNLFFDEEGAKPTVDGKRAVRLALAEFSLPVFWVETTGHYSKEKHNALFGS